MPGRTRSFRPSRTEQVSSARFRLPRADCYLWAALIAHPGGRGDRREGERGGSGRERPLRTFLLTDWERDRGKKVWGERSAEQGKVRDTLSVL